MDTSIQTYNLKERLIEQSLSRNIRFPGGDTPYVAGVRHKALEQFREIGLPHPNLERWRGTDLSKAFETDYHLSFDPAGKGVDIEALFNARFLILKHFWLPSLTAGLCITTARCIHCPTGWLSEA